QAAEMMGRTPRGLAEKMSKGFGLHYWTKTIDREAWRHAQRHRQLLAAEHIVLVRLTTLHKTPSAEIIEHTYCMDATEAQARRADVPQTYMGGELTDARLFKRAHGTCGRWVPLTEAVAA